MAAGTDLLPKDPVGPFVAGEFLSCGAEDSLLEVDDPATGRLLARVVDAREGAVDSAVASAEGAFRRDWSGRSPAERGRALAAVAAALRDQAAPLARLETLDTGKTLTQAKGDIETAARYFEFYAGAADKLLGETIPTKPDELVYTIREPWGVVGHIIPWNSPLSQMTRGVAPSLAAGNTVVVKPSELAPLTSLAAARLFVEAGLPPGACNVVVGRGREAGATLAAHAGVRHLTFTGSVSSGRAVGRAAADRVVPISLELGGKSPTIVLADAELGPAVAAATAALTRNAGQSCFATTRMLVQQSVLEPFLALLHKRVAALTVGPGLEDPDLGPLISAEQLKRVKDLVADAVNGGASAFAADVDFDDPRITPGHFCAPTVLSNVSTAMRVYREEVFGPVQTVIGFDSDEEAVALANDTAYGLAAGVFTRDFTRAHRLAACLEAGQVQINRFPAGGVEVPFGGYKQSGIGREKGLEALRHYTQLKTVIAHLPSIGT